MKGLVTEAGRQARSVLCNPRFLGARQHSQELGEVTASFRVTQLLQTSLRERSHKAAAPKAGLNLASCSILRQHYQGQLKFPAKPRLMSPIPAWLLGCYSTASISQARSTVDSWNHFSSSN